MTTTTRQNNLILAEDWTRIYQTFRNADFKSYDFENLRRVMVEYLRENYPEDFNDFVESSEYVALLDLIAFLGQSLAFRMDLNSRENFIELAERKESVLRIARMLSYNSKRNVAGSGLLKFTSVTTDEQLVDSAGINLSNQTINWNDPTNANWFEQFISVLNSAMVPNTEFGKNQGQQTIDGIVTDQYSFNSTNETSPLFNFSNTVGNKSVRFELVSTSILNKSSIYEDAPMPGRNFGFVYRQDGKGNASANTGFFMLFKQGTLQSADFQVTQPTVNEQVSIATQGINNDDVWLYKTTAEGALDTLWKRVDSVEGNNIIYNSLVNQDKDIYSVITQEDDQIDLLFSDGVFGNLPQGNFRTFYRTSAGTNYSIAPRDMRNVSISIPYINSVGASHTLSLNLSLQYTVDNSAASETIESIRTKAPALYYTQNRMVTGEDYNLAPLGSSQEILKVKAINRTSSGISRNFDIIDASGKYSMVNVFADDGLIYRTNIERDFSYRFTNKNIILNYIRSTIEPAIEDFQTYNFYLTNFDKIFTSDVSVKWLQTTSDTNGSTGYFGNIFDAFPIKVGVYTTSNLRFIEAGSLIKFLPPSSTQAFKDGTLVTYDPTDKTHKKYVWSKVVRVVGDGTNAGKGNLSSGVGPITLSDPIPDTAIPSQIVPKFVNNLSTDIETEILNLSFASQTFGLRYDVETRLWKLISSTNIDLSSDFSLGQAGNNTSTNSDASWLLAFVYDGDEFRVRIRGTDYVFTSIEQNRFYFDRSEKIYDSIKRTVVKDQIRVLDINSIPEGKELSAASLADQIIALKSSNPEFTATDVSTILEQDRTLKNDVNFEIADSVRYEDGYQSTESVKVTFYDSDDDGVIDNPDSFDDIVGTELDNKYVFFKKSTDNFGFTNFSFVTNNNNTILIKDKEVNVSVNDYTHNQLIYFYDQAENFIKRVDLITRTFILEPSYVAYVGRSGLKFQYVHNASSSRRIDPSASNIIDIYLLVRTYDINYRNYLTGATLVAPQQPTPESLRIKFGSTLQDLKSISDEVVYHPVTYFPLFGNKAKPEFQSTFKVVKNKNLTVNNNDLKVKIIRSISEYFSIENWDFGDKFYASELLAYIIQNNSPDISNIVMVPKQEDQAYGSLVEVQARPDEILVSAATVDDIQIVETITATELNLLNSQVITKTSNS